MQSARRTARPRRAVVRSFETLETRQLFATLGVDITGATGTFTSLQLAIQAASNGDTITVAPGVYNAAPLGFLGNQSCFFIDKSLTIKSTGGAGVTTLAVPNNTPIAVQIIKSNTRFEGFTVTGGLFGISAFDYVTLQGPGTDIFNIVVKDCVSSPQINPGGDLGHGILLGQAFNSVVDSCRVTKAMSNGIFVDGGANNLVVNSRVEGTESQHGLALKNTTGNQLVGNTVTGSGFHAIILVNAHHNTVRNNNLSGHKYDGITLSSGSSYNLISGNVMVSTGITRGIGIGSGIFLNSESNHNYVVGNSMTGSPENGIAVFNDSNNVIEGNHVFANEQGGVFVWTNPDATVSMGRSPNQNVVIRNHFNDALNNGGIIARTANNTLFSYNFVSGTAVTTLTDGGFNAEFDAHGSVAYHNTMVNVNTGGFVFASATGTQYYRNRHFSVADHYGLTPTIVAWDAGQRLGGNYYSNHTANADPSDGATPFRKQIFDANLGTRGGTNIDRYPFATETLGEGASVTVLEPLATATLTPGSLRTIRWDSTASVYVDLAYSSAATGTVVFAANQPDTGFYQWKVPTGLAAGTDYKILITPKNSSKTAIGAPVASDTLQVDAAAGRTLVLESQGRAFRADVGSSTMVGWTSTNTGPVAVEYQLAPGGTWTTLATAVAGEHFAKVTLPSTPTNTLRLRVRDTVSGITDVSDGQMTLVGGAGAITTSPAAASTVAIGSRQELRWLAPANTARVNIALVNGATATPVVSGLADTSNFTALTPDAPASGAFYRVTYLNEAGTALGSSDSAAFTIPGTPLPQAFDVIASKVNFTAGTYTSGQSITLSADITSVGSIASTAPTVNFYLSTDATIGSSDDILLGSVTGTAIAPNTTVTIATPAGGFSLANVPTSVFYYIGATVSATGDSSTADNAVDSLATAIIVVPGPASGFDIFGSSLSFVAGGYTTAQSFTASAVVIDQGTTASGAITASFFLSPDSDLGDGNDIFIGTGTGGSIAPNTSATIGLSTPYFLTTVPTGQTYYLGVVLSSPGEATTTNNTYIHPGPIINVSPGPTSGVDLTGTLSGKRPVLVIGAGFKDSIKLTVNNAGTSATTVDAPVSLFLSTTPAVTDTSVQVATATLKKGLKAKKSAALSFRFAYPASIANNSYFLVARVDAANVTADVSPGNNLNIATAAATPFQVINRTLGSVFSGPPAGFTQGKTGKNTFSFTFTNSGNVTLSAPLFVDVGASPDTTVDGGDSVLGRGKLTVSLKPGQSKVFKLSFKSTAAPVAPGTAAYLYATFTSSSVKVPVPAVTVFSPTPITFS